MGLKKTKFCLYIFYFKFSNISKQKGTYLHQTLYLWFLYHCFWLIFKNITTVYAILRFLTLLHKNIFFLKIENDVGQIEDQADRRTHF